jgi:hypothetical protein
MNMEKEGKREKKEWLLTESLKGVVNIKERTFYLYSYMKHKRNTLVDL